MNKSIIIYTDGSCLHNPGAGGWAALLIFGEKKKEIMGGTAYTTNNRMELTAAIEALSAIKQDFPITLYSDSRYVIDGIEKWCPNWIKNNWRKSDKKPVENKDLWEILYHLSQQYSITWQWVKAHANNEHNNYVDELAKSQAIKFQTDTSS